MDFSKQQMIEVYKQYGFDMPLKAKYKRNPNRIYFSGNFQDNEEIEFFWDVEKPSSCALGYAFYMGKDGGTQLVNIQELEPIN